MTLINPVIKLCKVPLFTDDTNLLYLDKCTKLPNKLVNTDLKNQVNQLNANEICLNIKKLSSNPILSVFSIFCMKLEICKVIKKIDRAEIYKERKLTARFKKKVLTDQEDPESPQNGLKTRC